MWRHRKTSGKTTTMKKPIPGLQIKLSNNRRVRVCEIDGEIFVQWVRMEGKVPVKTAIRMTPEAALASARLILDVLKPSMMRQP